MVYSHSFNWIQKFVTILIVLHLFLSAGWRVTASTSQNGTLLANPSARIASDVIPRKLSSIGIPFRTSSVPNELHVETPHFTGSSYTVSGHVVNFPTDLSVIVTKAKSERKPLSVYAVHLTIGSSSLSNIPHTKIFAHTCRFASRSVQLDARATVAPTLHNPNANGVTPQKPNRPNDSGDVEIFCAHIVNTSPSTLHAYTFGASGTAGLRGGPGYNGTPGTPTIRGRCHSRTKVFGITINCGKYFGRLGRHSTAGTNGARGGDGGDGSNGGNFIMTYGTNTVAMSVKAYNHGGYRGRGGYGGFPGKNGKYIKPIQYVTSCKKCKEGLTWEHRPTLATPRSGPMGSNGVSGSSGHSVVSASLHSKSISTVSDEDLVRFLAISERYYNNLVLSETSSSVAEALGVIETIELMVRLRKSATSQGWSTLPHPMIQSMADKAAVNKRVLQLRNVFYGPAILSRTAPNPLSKDVSNHLHYLSALKNEMTTSKLESNVLAAVTAAAGISIPGTDFEASKRVLRNQRQTFQQAIVFTELRIKDSSNTIETEIQNHILAKKEAAERAKQAAIFKAIKSTLNVALGVAFLDFNKITESTGAIIGTIKDIQVSFEDIKALKFKKIGKQVKKEFEDADIDDGELKEVLSSAMDLNDIYKEVTSSLEKAKFTPSCSFDDLRHYLQDSPDRIDKFPNLVEFDVDFSLIRDIGVVAELSKGLLDTRAEKLTAQFSCVLGEKLDDVPSIKAAFKNFFILNAKRIEMLDRMVDIDVELRKLKIIEEGVEAQKSSFSILSNAVSTVTRDHALAVMSVSFESARMRALETIERLASTYQNIALRDLQFIIRDYARAQLANNGKSGFDQARQYSDLVKVQLDVNNAYRSAVRCTSSREIPTPIYYSFDITAADSPEVFSTNGLRTGANNRTSLVLDINSHCAFYGGNHPPPRQLPNPGTAHGVCFPNKFTYNARMVSLAVELVGGDESLLPPGRLSAFATIDQVGRQTFHTKPGHFKTINTAPLQLPLGFIQLKADRNTKIVYHRTCSDDDATVDVDSPCPSPFSTYNLQISFIKDDALQPYLNTVTAIRMHTRLAAYSRQDTATSCFE